MKKNRVFQNKKKINGAVLTLAIIGLMALVGVTSCTQSLSDESGKSTKERTMTGGSVPITLYLYFAPKTITYTPGTKADPDGKIHAGGYTYDPSATAITDAFQANVWAWQVKSTGNTNYASEVWPGKDPMTPYDENDQALDVDENGKKLPVERTTLNDDDGNGGKKRDKIAYWKFEFRANKDYDVGILFNDTHAITEATGGQYAWAQTGDVVIPKEKIAKGKAFYFVYNVGKYYETKNDTLGLLAAEVTSTPTQSSTEVTIKYNNGTTFNTASYGNFAITDSSEPAQTGTVTAFNPPSRTDDGTPQSAAMTLSFAAVPALPIKIVYTTDEGVANPAIYATYSKKVIDDENTPITYNGDDLGVTINQDGTANFKMWSPMAKSVKVLLFQNVDDCGVKTENPDRWQKKPIEPDESLRCKAVDMASDGTAHIWKLENCDVTGYSYYKYRITYTDKMPTDAVVDGVKEGGKDGMKYNKETTRWVNTIEVDHVEYDAGGAVTKREKTFDVCDIWGKVAIQDSVASQIADIESDNRLKPSGWADEYYNPFNPLGSAEKKYSEAVLYEMNIADWAPDCKGNFQTIQSSQIIEHIKDLGITHVVLMPLMDYTYTNADDRYNWGFCTYNFNVPESRYAVAASDGLDVVKQLRQMVKTFHDAGVAVIMDVALTHTGNNKAMGGSQSLYDSTVPEYFYRMVNGEYSNGANQGTEIAAGSAMVKKYLIDCLKHWMKDYHINGFSFYLMGLTEEDVMKEIYKELSDIDPSVILYGEPWTGGRENAVGDKGTSKVIGAAGIAGAKGKNGVAVMDETFRTAVKGSELRGFKRGQVQGSFADNMIINGMVGKEGFTTDKDGNETSITHGINENQFMGIHYVETHDDNTLFDKLLLSLDKSAGVSKSYLENVAPLFQDLYDNLPQYIETIKKEDILAAAYVILAQGVPYISGGQEFLRTKRGNQDSSEAGRRREYTWIEEKLLVCNEIDQRMADTYFDVFCVYRGLIALRHDYLATDFCNITTATAVTIAEGVTEYTTPSFVMYFNATDSSYNIDKTGYLIDVSGGVDGSGFDSLTSHSYTLNIRPYTQSATKQKVTSVGAKSFVIIKK